MKKNVYDYNKLVINDEYCEEDNLSVGEAIRSMVYETWDNYCYDGLTYKEATDIVIDHLEDIYELYADEDYARSYVLAEVQKYTWE